MKKLVYESPSIQKMNTGLMNKFGTRSEYEPVKQIDGVWFSLICPERKNDP